MKTLKTGQILFYTLCLISSPIVFLVFDSLFDKPRPGLIVTGLFLAAANLYVLFNGSLKPPRPFSLYMFSFHARVQFKLMVIATLLFLTGLALAAYGLIGMS